MCTSTSLDKAHQTPTTVKIVVHTASLQKETDVGLILLLLHCVKHALEPL